VFSGVYRVLLGFDGMEFGKGLLSSFTVFIKCFGVITQFYCVYIVFWGDYRVLLGFGGFQLN